MVMEILIPNPAIRNLIREDKIHQIYSSMQTGPGQVRDADVQSVALPSLYRRSRSPWRWRLARSSNADELQDMINRGVLPSAARLNGRRSAYVSPVSVN